MRVWITAYALTQGILEIDACETHVPGSVTTGNRFGRKWFSGEGKNWHRTLEAAKARAEEMRTKKIAELNARIKRLKSKVF